MNVRVPCVRGYNEDQITIVLEDPEMKDCPVVLGTPTLFRVMEVIKESEISELAVLGPTRDFLADEGRAC